MNIYGKLGSSEQSFSNKPIDDLILMNNERPESDYVATADGEWVISKDTLLQKLQLARDSAMQEMTVTRDDKVYQTRPQDMVNFQVGIAQSQTKWVMADNTVKDTTVEELQSVYNEALDDAKEIWDNYITELEKLNTES